MAKAYWVVTYRSVSDQDRLSAYAELAGPAIKAAVGTFLARGLPATTLESGLAQRCVVIEFEDLEAAIAAYESPGYQEALAALGDAAQRDIRVMEGA